MTKITFGHDISLLLLHFRFSLKIPTAIACIELTLVASSASQMLVRQ